MAEIVRRRAELSGDPRDAKPGARSGRGRRDRAPRRVPKTGVAAGRHAEQPEGPGRRLLRGVPRPRRGPAPRVGCLPRRGSDENIDLVRHAARRARPFVYQARARFTPSRGARLGFETCPHPSRGRKGRRRGTTSKMPRPRRPQIGEGPGRRRDPHETKVGRRQTGIHALGPVLPPGVGGLLRGFRSTRCHRGRRRCFSETPDHRRRIVLHDAWGAVAADAHSLRGQRRLRRARPGVCAGRRNFDRSAREPGRVGERLPQDGAARRRRHPRV